MTQASFEKGKHGRSGLEVAGSGGGSGMEMHEHGDVLICAGNNHFCGGQSVCEVIQSSARALADLGFCGAAVTTPVRLWRRPFIVSGYPENWQQCYALEHLEQIDPVHLEPLPNLRLVCWDQFDQDRHMYYLFQQRKHGIQFGFSMKLMFSNALALYFSAYKRGAGYIGTAERSSLEHLARDTLLAVGRATLQRF